MPLIVCQPPVKPWLWQCFLLCDEEGQRVSYVDTSGQQK